MSDVINIKQEKTYRVNLQQQKTYKATRKIPTYIPHWYGFRIIKGQSGSLVTPIYTDELNYNNKPVHSRNQIYPAVVNNIGVVYKLGGSTGNNLTRKLHSNEASDLTGGDGEVMTVFEPFYYKVEIWSDGTNTYEDWKFSVDQLPGFIKTPKYYKGIYPAYYDSVTDKLRSVSGVTPETNKTRAWFRQKAANIGSGWCIEAYFMENIIYHLWIAESLSLNTQEALSPGATNANSGDWSTFCSGYWPVWTGDGGQLSSYADPEGVLNVNNPNTADVRHGEIPLSIENWGDGTLIFNTQIAVMYHCRDVYGHTWKLKDGLNIHNSLAEGARAFMSKNPGVFADDTESNYNMIGNIAESGGYISEFLNGHMLPIKTAGSSSQHAGDYHYTYYDNDPDSGWRVAFSGGHLSHGSNAGLAYFSVFNDSSYDYSHVGARLCKIEI